MSRAQTGIKDPQAFRSEQERQPRVPRALQRGREKRLNGDGNDRHGREPNEEPQIPPIRNLHSHTSVSLPSSQTQKEQGREETHLRVIPHQPRMDVLVHRVRRPHRLPPHIPPVVQRRMRDQRRAQRERQPVHGRERHGQVQGRVLGVRGLVKAERGAVEDLGHVVALAIAVVDFRRRDGEEGRVPDLGVSELVKGRTGRRKERTLV